MNRTSPLLLVAVAVVEILVGIGLAYTSPSPQLLWLAGAGTLGALVVGAFIRWGHLALKRVQRRLATADGPTGSIDSPDCHQEARVLYYAGVATMSWLVVRFHGFTLSDLFFLAAATLAFVEALGDFRYRFYRLPGAFVLGVLLFTLGSLIATIQHAAAPLASLGVLARVLYLLTVWCVLGTMVLRTPGQIRTAVGCWVLGAGVCGMWAIAQKLGYVPVDPTIAAQNRVPGLGDHVNDLGGLAAIALAPGLALLYTSRWKIAATTCLVGIVAGLFLSGSVGGGLAGMCALIVCLASRQLTRAALVGLAVSAAVVAYTGVGSSTQLARVSETIDPVAVSGEGTFHMRLDTYDRAWQRIKEDPLVGAGLDEASSTVYGYRYAGKSQVHNLFLGRWFESGILGVLGIVIIVGSIFATGWPAVVNAGRDQERLLALGVFAGLVAFVVFAMGELTLYKRYALAPVSIIFAIAAVQWRSRSMASSSQKVFASVRHSLRGGAP